MRYVAYALIPGLAAAAAAVSRASWLATENYQKPLRRACAALELPVYSPHDLRRYALAYWRQLGLSQEIRNAMAGHSAGVADAYYKPPTPAELVAMSVRNA